MEEEGLPRQDKYAIGLPCPDTKGQKGIDFLDFLDSKGVHFSDVADGKMTLDEFRDILTLDDCINLLWRTAKHRMQPIHLEWEIFRNTESRM